MQLVKVDSEVVLEGIHALRNGDYTECWLGLFDLNQNADNRLWRWPDFSPVVYANWESGQPDDIDFCVVQSGYTKVWWGKLCDQHYRFVCEVPQVDLGLSGLSCPSGFTEAADGMCYWPRSSATVSHCTTFDVT